MLVFLRTLSLLLILGSGLLWSRTLDFATLHAMPKSVEKDYYLWRYLSKKSTPKSEAKKLIKEAFRINTKLAKAYKKKTKLSPPRRRTKSSKSLSPKQKKEIKKKKALTLSLLKKPDPWSAWMALEPSLQLYVFNHAGKAGRKQLDHTITPGHFRTLSTLYAFNDSLYRIHKEHLKHWSKNLLNLPAKKHALTHASLMKLGFYALHRGAVDTAESYFNKAAQKFQKREETDQALFWAYQCRHNNRFLKRILRSYDINVYTLLARDFLHLDYPKTLSPSLPKSPQETSAISDPIHWAGLKRKIFDPKTDLASLAKHYRHADALGYYTYILAKASHDTDQYFPMPYRDLLSKLPRSRQAILYAIARQESRFVPASISTSYALGMMQIMPFLVRHLAKKRHEKVDYDAMFDPRKALTYSNEHMNYLTKWLKHPLFIAYAYNAGIGYTRRMIRKPHLFNGKGAYEPYLSLELVDNAQARHYGKHVLANYVIYMNKLGTPLRMVDLLSFIHDPRQTDRFRKRKK